MLIYNYQKEFLGIDEKDLKTLGFKSLSELRAEVTDFADLFVKTPGYIHNFQHVHWIDFVNYANASEESKVLINVNAKTFKATLAVAPIFLIDNPTSSAYMIYLNNLRPLSKSEYENISSDVLDRELPKVEPQAPKVFTPTPEVAPAKHDIYDQESQIEKIATTEEEPLEVYEEPTAAPAEKVEDMLDVDDFSLDVFEEQKSPEPSLELEEKITSTPTVEKEITEEEYNSSYHYDPHIASKELGLPLDLIEEFIQDFIAQAKEFKPDIYTSIEDGDVDNVKILSHKLKGVAANLRIEDAHEVLSAVSATSDMNVIHENLNTFYKIIAKLAGEPDEKIAVSKEEKLDIPEMLPEITEDEIAIVDEKDEDIPEKIEMPELADDDFLDIEIAEDENETKDEVAVEDGETTETINFNKADAAQEIGIDEASFNELFEDFVAESHTIFQKIDTAIKNDDLQTCHNEALKFKGMSDNMRFHEFTKELEILIHSSDKHEIMQAAEKIDARINKISKIGA